MPFENSDLLIELSRVNLAHKKIIDYCYPYLDTMWAAEITSMILGCDFRDAKKQADIFISQSSKLHDVMNRFQ